MMTKYKIKSETVVGLSFHPLRPWILVSFVDGNIQLWDYSTNVLIKAFAEHDGPVRGVDFHRSLPLFVSGGDDSKIKVWNLKRRQSLFTLLEHSDSVRSVKFHQIYPWIVSSGDDKTFRIWNWETQSCISVLDIASLRGDTTSPVSVTHVFEDNDDRVLCASFHPTNTFIVSDKSQLSRMLKTGTWEKRILDGHTDTVSHVMFPSKHDMIVSASEDRSICLWDATKQAVLTRTVLHKDHGKLSTLAVHPEKALMAAGHGKGLIIFKITSRRPAFVLSGDSLFYAKCGFFWRYDFSTKAMTRMSVILPMSDMIRMSLILPMSDTLNPRLKAVSYSPAEKGMVIFSSEGCYHLRWISKIKVSLMMPDAASAFFVREDCFAVLEEGTNQVRLWDLQQNLIDEFPLPLTPDAIFYAGPEKLLFRSKEKLVIFDFVQNQVLGYLETPFVRYIVWSNGMDSVALLSKYDIIIASNTLVHQCTIHERIRVKSGAWDENGVFIYTTLSHIKYCLPSGDSGIIKSLDFPIYVTKVSGNIVHCLDRDVETRDITIDATEYLFKLSLLKNNKEQAMKMIDSRQLVGQAMVGYLQQKGFPEMAFSLAEDVKVKFNLAIECGNFGAAVELAEKMKSKADWNKLGMEARRQGYTDTAELAFKKSGNLEMLSFLYMVTGNLEKLKKMKKIVEDPMAQYHNALYLGDVKERVKILEKAGHLHLAYATASVHGLHDDVAERLARVLGDNLPSLPEGKTPLLLLPPSPVMRGDNWPLLEVNKETSKGGREEHVEDDVEPGEMPMPNEEDDGHVEPGEMPMPMPNEEDDGHEVSELRYRGRAHGRFH